MSLLDQFPLFMSYCKKQFHKAISAYLAPYGVSGMNAAYLKTLSESPGITMPQLTEKLKVSRATTSRAVAALEQAGFVTDDRVKNDGKKYRLYLTERGAQLEKGLSSHISAYNRELLARLTPEEQETLNYLLKKLMRL